MKLEPTSVGSCILLSLPFCQHKASRQRSPWLYHVNLYPPWIWGQTEKCKFWQLPLWALTSQDSFSPRPHPGSDFPTSAIIYWQDLFLFLTLKELPSTVLNKAPCGSVQWTESPFPHSTSPAPGNIFLSIVSHFCEDAGNTSHLQTFPIVSLSAPNKGKAPGLPSLTQAAGLRPHSIFPRCLVASNLFKVFISSVTWC